MDAVNAENAGDVGDAGYVEDAGGAGDVAVAGVVVVVAVVDTDIEEGLGGAYLEEVLACAVEFHADVVVCQAHFEVGI